MSSKTVWVVVESICSNKIPIVTYENNNLLGDVSSSSFSNIFRKPKPIICPEFQVLVKPENIENKQNLSNIKLIGVYLNLESAKSAVANKPNRILLGPAIIQ